MCKTACRIRPYFYSFCLATHNEMCVIINHVMSILYGKKRHFSTLNTEERINGQLFTCSCVSPFDSLVPLSILRADHEVLISWKI